MNEKTQDRRIAKTNRIIRDAFVELLNEKSFEEITVNDLSKRADINRGTFYLHYRDKFELLEKYENEIISSMVEYISGFKDFYPTDLIKADKIEPPLFIVKLFEFIGENATFIKVALGPQANPSFQNKLKKVFIDRITKNTENKFEKEKLDIPFEYLLVFITSNYIGCIQHWLITDMATTPEETAKILIKLMAFGSNGVFGFYNISNEGKQVF
ncbi:TetR/AcrR family transcriptional regulator [Gottfriedia acidiceleris]|uniref:TetR/AcrR family transcriptional regulator n=1 Tax=Gottfriedia acidiceleris TaxID=371036 RepID=UPI003D1FA5CA